MEIISIYKHLSNFCHFTGFLGFMVLRKLYGILDEFIVFKELLYSLKELWTKSLQ